ncbi:C40 family peptidase, partial [Streptomyces sp. NPDC046915]|uniref:C40 family peptidase n=1 Tax=Streptomyces sp. NPDC046915 TaxID=3155257 RepID=UPI0033DD88AD
NTGMATVAAPLTNTAIATAPSPAPAPVANTGTFSVPNPLMDSGAFTAMPPWAATGVFPTANPVVAPSPVLPSPVPVAAAPAPVAAPAPAPAPAPVPVPVPYEGRAAQALAFARAQIGRPCVWGATGPDSYDCSSLTQVAWRAAGVTLPRAAREQADAGTPVALSEAQPGDLVIFFQDAGHVGLYSGNGMMIHAPGQGAYIREESVYGAGEAAIHRVIRPA